MPDHPVPDPLASVKLDPELWRRAALAREREASGLRFEVYYELAGMVPRAKSPVTIYTWSVPLPAERTRRFDEYEVELDRMHGAVPHLRCFRLPRGMVTAFQRDVLQRDGWQLLDATSRAWLLENRDEVLRYLNPTNGRFRPEKVYRDYCLRERQRMLGRTRDRLLDRGDSAGEVERMLSAMFQISTRAVRTIVRDLETGREPGLGVKGGRHLRGADSSFEFPSFVAHQFGRVFRRISLYKVPPFE